MEALQQPAVTEAPMLLSACTGGRSAGWGRGAARIPMAILCFRQVSGRLAGPRQVCLLGWTRSSVGLGRAGVCWAWLGPVGAGPESRRNLTAQSSSSSFTIIMMNHMVFK